MAEDFIHDNTKKQKIDKMFHVIDKNKDNKEICKIAFDTLNSKCLENPSNIFPIMTNFLSLISKGNLKLIEEGNQILINFFQDFNNKDLTKILLDNDIKKDLLAQLKDGKTEYPVFRCLGRYLCQEIDGLRVFGDKQHHPEGAFPLLH